MSKLITLQLGDEWHLNDEGIRNSAISWFNAVRDQYPNTILYNNNFGGQVNDAALDDFIRRARPDMICFDTYPFRSDYTTRQPVTPPGGSHFQWFGDLRRYRQHAMGNGIPLGAYTQTFRAVQDYDQTVYRDPSTSEMNLNNFGALAFNVKVLIDFTYNTGASSLFTSPGGDSNPNPLYHHRKEINRQVKNLSPALCRLTCINKLNAGLASIDTVFIRGRHSTGPGTSDYNALPISFQPDSDSAAYSDWEFGRNDPYLSGWSVSNSGSKNNSLPGDVIISWFKVLDESMDGPAAGEVYFMVVNGLTDAAGTAAECRQSITLDFAFGSSGLNALQRLSRDSGQVETLLLPLVNGKRRLSLQLDGGAGDLFKFYTGAPFVGAAPDTTPPGPVASFTATAASGQVTLTWTNPSNPDFSGTLIRRKAGGPPSGPTDGDLVADLAGTPGAAESFTDTGLAGGITYHYAAFAHDRTPNYAPVVRASVMLLATADFDDDDDVDQQDFGFLQLCLSGLQVSLSPGCEAADLNGDGFLTTDDVTVFLTCMGGPDQPSGC
jgi:hypothetical protein